MAQVSIIPSSIIPIQKKVQKKTDRMPIYSEKILKAEAERKAKENKILRYVGEQKAKQAALKAKQSAIISTAGYRLY